MMMDYRRFLTLAFAAALLVVILAVAATNAPNTGVLGVLSTSPTPTPHASPDAHWIMIPGLWGS